MNDRGGATGTREVRFLGVPVERHRSVGSTNDEAFRRAEEGAPEGLVVVARTQTAGRGRQGRVWHDAPGASLSFSLLLRPRVPLPQYPLLALAMACAVADAGGAAARTTLEVKWPNDVIHRGRKLSGILAESRVLGGPGGGPPLVIGVGVNVGQVEEDFPPEIRGAATSLRLAGGGDSVTPDSILEAILARFERLLGLAPGGDAGALWREITPRLPRAGTRVSVRSGGRIIDGIVEGISETGALKVRESGREEAVVISAGEMA